MFKKIFVKFLLIYFFVFNIFSMENNFSKNSSSPKAIINCSEDWEKVNSPVKKLNINITDQADFAKFLDVLDCNQNLFLLSEVNLVCGSIKVFAQKTLNDLFSKLEKLQNFSLIVGNPFLPFDKDLDSVKILDINGLSNLKNLRHFYFKFLESSNLSNFSENISQLYWLESLDLELSYKHSNDFDILIKNFLHLQNLNNLKLNLSSNEILNNINIKNLNVFFNLSNNLKSLDLCTFLDPENDKIFINLSKAISEIKNLEQLSWEAFLKNSKNLKQDDFAKITKNLEKLNKLKKLNLCLPTFEDFLNLKKSSEMISKMDNLEDLSLQFSAFHNEENYKTYDIGLKLFIETIGNAPKIRNLKLTIFEQHNQSEAIVKVLKSRKFRVLSLVGDTIHENNMKDIFTNLSDQDELEILGVQLPNLQGKKELIEELVNYLTNLNKLKNLKELQFYACLVDSYSDHNKFPNFESIQKDSFYQAVKNLISNLPNLEKQRVYFGIYFEEIFKDLNKILQNK